MNTFSFSEWLQEELNKRGWSQAELSRRAGFAATHVSMILNEHRKPGPDFLEGVARALNLPADQVFRLAGLLPPEPKADPLTEAGTHLLQQLPPEDRERMVEMMRALVAWQESQKC